MLRREYRICLIVCMILVKSRQLGLSKPKIITASYPRCVAWQSERGIEGYIGFKSVSRVFICPCDELAIKLDTSA